MKKLLLLVAIVATSFSAMSQAFTTKDDVKNYINAKIIPNTTRAITPDVMKKILLGLWEFDADSIWLNGTNIKYRRGSLVFTIPFTTSSGLSDTSFLHKGLTESVWGVKNFLNYTTGLAPALSDSSNIFITSGWVKRYLAAHPLTELDPIWTAASINYYTKVQSDARFVPLTRNLTINGVTHDLSIDRSWTIPPVDTTPLHNQIITKLNAGKQVTSTSWAGNDSVHVLVLHFADGTSVQSSVFDRGSGGGGGSSFDSTFIYAYAATKQDIADTNTVDATRFWVQSQNYLTSYTETDPLSVHVADSSSMLLNYLNNVGYGLLRSGKVVRADTSLIGSKTYIANYVTSNPNGFLTSYTETDPIANAKTITATQGSGILITGTAGQTLTSNPSWTFKVDSSLISTKYNVNNLLLGYVPTTRTITINGTAFDLSANRSWSVGTVTSVGLTSTDITVGGTASPITGSGTFTLTLPTINSNVGTFNNVTVNGKGQVTAASNVAYLTGNQTITLTGDVSGSGSTAITTTLATVNSNVGTWNNVTVNGKGLVTAGSNVAYLTTATDTTGAPLFIVAASNAPAALKKRADYVCDGTNDEAEINTALGLGNVQLTEGTFNISTTGITMASNRILEGVGDATKLVAVSYTITTKMIKNSGSSNIILRNFMIDGASHTMGYGIYFELVGSGLGDSAVTGCHISNIYIKNAYQSAIELQSCRNSILNDLRITSPNWDGIVLKKKTGQTKGCIGITIQGTVQNNSTAAVWMQFAENCNIINNIFEGDSTNSRGQELIEIEASSKNINIVGNQVYNSQETGIWVNDVCENISIIGNTVYGSLTAEGIYCTAPNSVISNNTVFNNGHSGIYFENAVTVTGNRVYSNSQSANNTYDGIQAPFCTDCAVTNNVISKGSLTNKQRYGISVTNSTRPLIEGNHLYSSGTSGDIDITGTTTAGVRNNIANDGTWKDLLITAYQVEMSTNKLLGRTTASQGAIEEISVGSNLSFASGVLKFDSSSSATGFHTQPYNDLRYYSISNPSAFISAANLALGTATSTTLPITNSGGTGFTLPVFSTTAGLVPGGTSNTTDFLRKDGTWAVPPGSSGVTTMANIGGTPNADGATISGSTLTLQPANATFGGLLTTGTQDIAGQKTFKNSVIWQSGSGSALGQLGAGSSGLFDYGDVQFYSTENAFFGAMYTNVLTANRVYNLPDVSGTLMVGTGSTSGTNTGDQNIFSSIPVSGQTTVTANSTATALTFVAGSNMTITTNNSTKTITFASTGSGTGTVTATGGSLTSNAVVLGAGTTDTKVSTGITTNGTAQLILGVNTTTLGSIKMFGSTSGDATIQPNVVAGTATVLTLPASTGTLALTSQITGTNSGTNTGDQTTTGTTNRITVTNGSTNPVIDISSSYVGQSTITTLGTVTTGVWNGTAITYSNLNVTGAILNADLAGSINATKINTGVVDNTEFNYLDGVTSGIQGQLNNLQTLATAVTGLTAAGTNQSTALVLSGSNSIQEITTAASGTGVQLPVATTSSRVTVVNRGANAIVVYPATSGSINGQSVNLGYTLPVNGAMTFIGKSSTAWYNTVSFQNGDVNTTDASGALVIGAGKVTNAMLAGSISNANLANSTVTVNGTSIALGASGTITAAAGTLTGTVLNSTVVTSSLTSVGSLTSLTMAGDIALGANNLTITGSIGATGARSTKGWFTNLEISNMPTVGGTSLSTTFQASDADLTTIAGLTATTDNFIVSVASAWASRTPAQVKTTLAIDNVTNESKATMFTSPTFTGTVTFPASTSFTTPVLGAATGTSLVLSSFLNEAKGADIASATTTDIGAMTGNYGDVTGTTTITALGTVQAGTRRTVRFTGALTLTHNATSLILPGGVNITTVAGDVAQFVSLGAGNWRCVAYTPITVTGTGSQVRAASPTFTGTVTFPTSFVVGATTVTTTGTQLNYLNAATGTTGTTSTNLVYSTSPTLVTPALGTPTALVLTNATGLPSLNKAISLAAPSASETIDFFYTAAAITVTEVREVLRGSTPSVTYTINYGSSPTVATNTIVASHAATSTSGVAATLNITSIPAGSYIWITTSATSGTVSNFAFTMTYTQ